MWINVAKQISLRCMLYNLRVCEALSGLYQLASQGFELNS